MSNDNLEHGWIVNDYESEDKEYCTCEWCGEPIYIGDIYYDLNGDKVCEDCIMDCRKTAND